MTRFCTCSGSISSSLESRQKRKQPAERSCKTCGGKYLVDGIVPISVNMLGTVGLEVANSVNTELSWNTAAKGKRSRKKRARTLNGRLKLAHKSPKRVGDFSGSDSDKFVEPANGQPFQDRIENVPIKKRRHLFRSPSPPPETFYDGPESPSRQFPTQSLEDVEHLLNHHAPSGRRSSGSYSDRQEHIGVGCRTDDRVLGDKVGGEFYSSDFSGIALLAAAACINNLDDDSDYVNGDVVKVSSAIQVSSMSSSPFPCGENISSSISKGHLGQDLSLVEPKKHSSVMDCSVPDGHKSDKNDVCTLVKSVSLKAERLHWDLNTLMEAWEEPHDDVAVGNKLTVDAEPLEKATELSKPEDKRSEDFPCVDGLSSASNEDVEMKSPSPVCKKESGDKFPMAESSHGSGPFMTSTDVNFSGTSDCLTLSQGEDHILTGSTKMDTSEQQVVLSWILGSEKSGNKNDFYIENAEGAQKSIESLENCVEYLESISEEHHLSSKCEDLSTSDISIGCQSALFGDGNAQEEKDLATYGKNTLVGMHPDRQKTLSEHDDHLVSDRVEEKISIQESVKGSVDDDSHKSDVSQDGCHLLEENSDEIQVDYDSPYEDGELRGPVLCCWDGNELEDGEHEHVDYGSDDRDGEDSDAGDCPGSEIVEGGSEGSQGTERNALVHNARNNYEKSGPVKSSLKKELNDNKDKIEVAAKKGLNQVSGSAHVPLTDSVTERTDASLRRRHASDYIDISDAKWPYRGDVEPKATREKLQSRIEGPSLIDIYERNIQEGRYRNIVGSLSRSEREGSPDRFASRYRYTMPVPDRSGDGRWICWDSRNRYQSSYRGLENHGQTRSRIGNFDSVDKLGGLNFHDHKQRINHSSKGMQRQQHVRGRSPIDRVDIYGVHRRIAGVSNHRNRGTSGNFSEVIDRGLRDEYNERMIDDSLGCSGQMPRYLSQRDRSFSPPGRVSHRRSRSRSRTVSPHAWQSQRERNISARRRSRSPPEFRPEPRRDRMRGVPFQKHPFPSVDYGERFMSPPPRGRISPQRSYNRWVDNRNFVDDHSRRRRSPNAMFRRSQKLDHVGFSGRMMKPEDHQFRAVGRPGRLPVIEDGIGRTCKLEETAGEDRSGMMMMMQRGRHSEGSGVMRRSRHEAAEDSVSAAGGGGDKDDEDIRSTDLRDVPRSAREDKQRTFKV